MPHHPSVTAQVITTQCRQHWSWLRRDPLYPLQETQSRMYPHQLRVTLMHSGVWVAQHSKPIQAQILALSEQLFPSEDIYYAAYTRQIQPSNLHTDAEVLGAGAPVSTLRAHRSALLPLHSERKLYSTQLFNDAREMTEELWDEPGTVGSWLVSQLHCSRPWHESAQPHTPCRDYLIWHTRR